MKKRGFAYYVGGGLGAVPSMAKLLSDFVPIEELFPISQAVCRVFARLAVEDPVQLINLPLDGFGIRMMFSESGKYFLLAGTQRVLRF